MPPSSWKPILAAEPGREYLVLGTRLALRSYLRIPQFVRMAFAIQRQLAKSDGLVGYALNAQLTRKTFWTVSAWTDPAALDAFVRTLPHSDIMRRLRPHLETGRFRTWNVPGSALPIGWAEAEAHLTQDG